MNQSHKDIQCVKLIYFVVISTLCAFLSSCEAAPARRQVSVSPPKFPMPSTQIYFYPNKNQTEQQQDRDHYECNLWAIKESHYDPAQAQLAPHQRIEVIPSSPSAGSGAATGAVVGGIAGSVLSDRHQQGEGLVLGAIAGALIGASSDEAKASEAERIAQHENAKRYAILEEQSRNYRRAITACLEGRGYTVR